MLGIPKNEIDIWYPVIILCYVNQINLKTSIKHYQIGYFLFSAELKKDFILMLTKFTCTYLPFLLSSSCQNLGISHTDKVRVIHMIYVANQYRDCVIWFFFSIQGCSPVPRTSKTGQTEEGVGGTKCCL